MTGSRCSGSCSSARSSCIALLAPWLAPYPDQGRGAANVEAASLAPSGSHLFGTDELGRDMLSRVIMGTRPALLISISVVLVAALIGVPLGAVAGYRGGWVDEVLMRVTEVFQSFPPLLLAMVVVALLGPDLKNAALALVVSWWPWYARLVRAEAKSLRERPFVAAAEAIGVPSRTILRRHIIKNSMTPSTRPGDRRRRHGRARGRIPRVHRPRRTTAGSGLGTDGRRGPQPDLHGVVGLHLRRAWPSS